MITISNCFCSLLGGGFRVVPFFLNIFVNYLCIKKKVVYLQSKTITKRIITFTI